MGITAMIVTYGNKLAKDLVEENFSKEVRAFPQGLARNARKKLAMLHAAKELKDLLVPPGNRLEKLKGDLKDFHPIRINDQFRVVFRFSGGNAHEVSVEDYRS